MPIKVEEGGVVVKKEKEAPEIVAVKIKREKEEPSDEDFVATKQTRKRGRKAKESIQVDIKEEKKETAEDGQEVTKVKNKRVKVTKEVTKGSPFPTFSHPTPEECREVCKSLGKLHGTPRRPNFSSTAKETFAAGCGEVPNVIQAIIRTILSQNTTQENGSRAYKSMTKEFGALNWEAIHKAPQEDLAAAIMCGGLGKVKAKYIKSMLNDVYTKYGKFSLDHFHQKTDEEVFSELVQFQGVGPKTASCVLLFCLKRESFAVDTHIFRITKRIGWVPPISTRETAFLHLDERIPDDLKYPLHTLLIRHGKACKNCAANGNTRDKKSVINLEDCPLRGMSKYSEKTKKAKKEEKVKKEAKAKKSKKSNLKIESDGEDKEYDVEDFSLEVEGTGK